MILEFTNKSLRSSAEPISDDELCGFIGILLLFGVSKKRMVELDEMWSHDSIHFSELQQSQCYAQGSRKS